MLVLAVPGTQAMKISVKVSAFSMRSIIFLLIRQSQQKHCRGQTQGGAQPSCLMSLISLLYSRYDSDDGEM